MLVQWLKTQTYRYRVVLIFVAAFVLCITINVRWFQYQDDQTLTTWNMDIPQQKYMVYYYQTYHRKSPIEELLANQTLRRLDLRRTYRMNVFLSDRLPLNRYIPDTRPVECSGRHWPSSLPKTSVVICYHNEWPSVLLRTIYSIVERTPEKLLDEIILVDDASTEYVFEHVSSFTQTNLKKAPLKYIRLSERQGLIRARMVGLRNVKSEVVVFLDSHMEVNFEWLEPLLVEISNRKDTIAMCHLDYINAKSFTYSQEKEYRTRYGFDWRMHFFETYFRDDQVGAPDGSLPGVIAVGSGFAVNVKYFKSIGAFDDGMIIWGGENIELSLRVWMCGGQLRHVACSKIGHIARNQPYSFLDDRLTVEMFNYKRIVEIWFDGYKQYVYDIYPRMKTMDVGSLQDRKNLRKRLTCKSFGWFLQTIWPELLPYRHNTIINGIVKNGDKKRNLCLNNNNYLFSWPERLEIRGCSQDPVTEMFALTTNQQFRTILHCVTVQQEGLDYVPFLQSCPGIKNVSSSLWIYEMGLLKHLSTSLCLELLKSAPILTMNKCDSTNNLQRWSFSDMLVQSSTSTVKNKLQHI